MMQSHPLPVVLFSNSPGKAAQRAWQVLYFQHYDLGFERVISGGETVKEGAS